MGVPVRRGEGEPSGSPRSLSGLRDETSMTDSVFSYDDQEQAMLAGFNSVAEWAIAKLVPMMQNLERRVAALENKEDE